MSRHTSSRKQRPNNKYHMMLSGRRELLCWSKYLSTHKNFLDESNMDIHHLMDKTLNDIKQRRSNISRMYKDDILNPTTVNEYVIKTIEDIENILEQLT